VSAADVHELVERAAQARETARETAARYVELCALIRSEWAASQVRREAVQLSRDAMREAVDRYALLLQSLGTSPERTLRLVKEAVREDVPPEMEHSHAPPFMEQVVLWCIESYYRDTPAA
jgi:hypothetical protein